MLFSPQEITTIIHPLLRSILKKRRAGKPLLVGIQGGQGTGKSTLVKYVEQNLQARGLQVVSFSLDDFYLSWKERQHLALKYPSNPFYQISRGMPGTHRVDDLFKVLQRAKKGRPFTLPIFDKSLHHGAGDIANNSRRIRTKQDIILFEGWCLGMPMIKSAALRRICAKYNIPLRRVDPTLQQHPVVLSFAQPYQKLWKILDYVIQLRPDSPELHHRWREKQEKELWKRKKKGMTPQEVHHFVSLYLPVTYLCYEKVKPDALVKINKKHELYRLSIRIILKDASK